MTLDEQLAYFDQHVDEAYDLLLDFVREREEDCKKLARERLVGGYYMYGDASFETIELANVEGAEEEHADLLNYIIFAIYAREHGRGHRTEE